MDKILQDIGYFSIITKDTSGINYFDELARQIYQVCLDLFPRFGGIISLLDIYYFMNKKRTTCLLNAGEIT